MGIRRLWRALLASGVAVSAVAGAPVSAAAVPGWRVDLVVHPPTPDRASDPVTLTSVAAPGAADVWAAGAVSSASSRDSSPVVVHWNGRTWRVLRPAAPITSGTAQFEIAASGNADVWLFNEAPSRRLGDRPMWAHWDGRAWTRGALAVPVVSGGEGVLITAAAAPGPHDVWVGGTIDTPGTPTALPGIPFLMHYNGRTWRFYQFGGASDSLPAVTSISALSPSDIWALASPALPLFGVGVPNPQNLLLHWNGNAWRRMLLGRGRAPLGNFYSVVGQSARTAWLTGTVHRPGPHGGTWAPGAGYWNGARWTLTSAAAPYPLTSAVSDGHGGLWAVSQPNYAPQSELAPPAGFWHYADGRWAHVPVPAISGWDIVVQLARAPGTASVWAAGSALRSGSGAVPRGPGTGLILGTG